jgi:ubiquinone biosynthesis protein UbiJ
MDPYLPINGRGDLAREITSHGVVSTNRSALELARARKDKVMALQNEVNDLKKRMERLEAKLFDDHK